MKIIFTLLLFIQFFYTPDIYTQEQLKKSTQVVWDAEHSAFVPDWLNPILFKHFKYFEVNIPQTAELHKYVEILKMDSIIATSLQGDWLKFLFEYDADKKITEQLSLGNIGNGWSNSDLHLFKYDENKNLIQDILFGWYIDDWDSLARINYTYNPQGDIYQFIFQTYTDNAWINLTRTTYNYDSYGNEINNLLEEWQNNVWVNQFLFSTYYSDNNRRDSLLSMVWDNDEWLNYSKTLFYYDKQTGYLEYFLARLWTGTNWQNYLLRTIKNDQNGNQIEQYDDLWNGGSWGKNVRRFYTYNSLNYIEDGYCEIQDVRDWVNGEDVIMIENPDGYRVSFITYLVSIYYKTTGVNEDINFTPQVFTLEQNYPNPFNPTTNIKYSIPPQQNPLLGGDYRGGLVTLKVYDVLGNEITTLVNEEKPAGSYEIEFDGIHLPSGIYFYRLQAGSYVKAKKMLLLK